MIGNLSTSLFNRYDGSTGGDFSELNVEEVISQFKNEPIKKQRIKEIVPIIEHTYKLRKQGFKSVTRGINIFNQESRREKDLHVSSRIGQYASTRRNKVNDRENNVADAYCKTGLIPNKKKNTIQSVSRSTGN
jgi:predicted amidophosphoribosyltransferase